MAPAADGGRRLSRTTCGTAVKLQTSFSEHRWMQDSQCDRSRIGNLDHSLVQAGTEQMAADEILAHQRRWLFHYREPCRHRVGTGVSHRAAIERKAFPQDRRGRQGDALRAVHRFGRHPTGGLVVGIEPQSPLAERSIVSMAAALRRKTAGFNEPGVASSVQHAAFLSRVLAQEAGEVLLTDYGLGRVWQGPKGYLPGLSTSLEDVVFFIRVSNLEVAVA